MHRLSFPAQLSSLSCSASANNSIANKRKTIEIKDSVFIRWIEKNILFQNFLLSLGPLRLYYKKERNPRRVTNMLQIVQSDDRAHTSLT